jgi:hypothetical protein
MTKSIGADVALKMAEPRPVNMHLSSRRTGTRSEWLSGDGGHPAVDQRAYPGRVVVRRIR